MFSSKSNWAAGTYVYTMNNNGVSASTLILLPARDEENHIGDVLSALLNMYPDCQILVINDCSSDSTSRVVRQFPPVVLIELPFWMGYGGALQAGYKYAIRNDFQRIVQMDADGQHDPSGVARLLKGLSEADVVVGSRFKDSASMYRMPLIRRLGCRVLSSIAWVLTGMKITDPTSGFQALNRHAMEIASQDYYPLDYPDLDVLILMHRHKLRVLEIPVVMYPAEEKEGMHNGIQIWYYALKMLLSMFVIMLRRA